MKWPYRFIAKDNHGTTTTASPCLASWRWPPPHPCTIPQSQRRRWCVSQAMFATWSASSPPSRILPIATVIAVSPQQRLLQTGFPLIHQCHRTAAPVDFRERRLPACRHHHFSCPSHPSWRVESQHWELLTVGIKWGRWGKHIVFVFSDLWETA